MRVIAGSARGRRLTAPKGTGTRPTPDRVREALFSILGARVAAAHVLDLFAGTGALGIEALSRGAARAVFVEADRGTATLIERNLAVLGRADTRVLPMSASRALTLLAREGARFDLAFLDPPYDAALLAPTLAELANARLMRDEAVVVCEHSRRTPPPTPPDSWGCVDSRSYGEVGLVLFQPSGGAA